jgi:hypothetical protein
MTVDPLPLRTLHGFVDPATGELRELRDPDWAATARQLARLNRDGMLVVVPVGTTEPITVGQAAYAIDTATQEKDGAA